jgi:hypothetical protein
MDGKSFFSNFLLDLFSHLYASFKFWF